MALARPGADPQLPVSHYFITVARGCSMRTFTMRTGLLRSAVGFLALLGCWSVGSTLYLAFHDDLMASMMARQTRMQYAYEDRIAVLRGQVDHEASRQLLSQNTLDGKMRELSLRASELEMRASLVAQLADRVGLPHLSDHALIHAGFVRSAAEPADDVSAIDNPASQVEVTHSSQASGPRQPASPTPAEDKPHPEARLDRRFGTGLSGDLTDGRSVPMKIAGLAATLEQVDSTQYQAISTIGDVARKKAARLRGIIASVGLSPERFKLPASNPPVGGPFVPLDSAFSISPFGRAVASLQADVSAAERLRHILPRVPLASPLPGESEVTSSFGARSDPFLGRLAMHTGVDLRDGIGTDVRATAPGRVVSAGPAGGYGNMIEVDHGDGLSTRYAHLSAILVSEGQKVEAGTLIGEVGATGRATGPHLHYETRIDGEPVDPMRFLNVGQRIAALDPAL